MTKPINKKEAWYLFWRHHDKAQGKRGAKSGRRIGKYIKRLMNRAKRRFFKKNLRKFAN